MKIAKICSALALAGLASTSYAVNLVSEGFDDITTLPGNGWVLANVSSPSAGTPWFQGDNTTAFTAQSGDNLVLSIDAGVQRVAEKALADGIAAARAKYDRHRKKNFTTSKGAAIQYKYIWKTDKAWVGSCRRLTLKFIDGSVRTVDFQFNK